MKKGKLLFISLLIVIVGVFTFMRTAFVKPVYIDAPLTISTSDVKNPLTAGREIRVKAVLADGIDVLPQLIPGNGWKMDGDLLVCYENDSLKHSVSVQLSKVSDISITFIGQRGSGNASVSVGDQETLIDLYRDSDWEEISWTYKAPKEFAPFSRIDILLEMVVMVWVILSIAKFWRSCRT